MLHEPFDADRPGAAPRDGQREPREPGRNRQLRTTAMVGIPLILVAAAIYWYRGRAPALPPEAAPQAATMAPPDPIAAEAQAQARDQQAAHVLTQAGEGTDERLRRQLAVLSADPLWLSWLEKTPDLIESASVILANVSDDEDPRKRMAAVRPGGNFEAIEQGGQTIQSSASAHRYDASADAIASLDARALTPIWRTLHPLISVAYHAVARPGVSLDRAAGNALKRIADVQIPEQPAPLQRVGKLWLYVDPDVEKQGAVEKMLLRMGAANARKLQTKARELRAALSLP